MDFNLSEEQGLLKDSVERFVRDRYSLDQRRALAATETGYSEAYWAEMAELGWLAATVPEAYGGIGGGPVETMVLMEGFGAGLVLEPYLASVVLAGTLVERAGSEAQKSELLGSLADGSSKLAFAYVERQSGFDLFDVECTARRDGDGWVLDGHKGVVLNAATADRVIVSARTAGGTRERAGIGLFVVDRDASGITRRDYRTNDGGRASELALAEVHVDAAAVLGDPEGAYPAIELAATRATAALCAEAVGCMQVLVDSTNEYLKTREQFGRPIGQFQVLQHQMVDMLIALEESRSMALMLTMRIEDGDETALPKAVSGAKLTIGKKGQHIGESSVQLHGGMGMTEEMHVGHYYKRLMMIDLMLGDHRYHLRRYADL